MVTNPFYWLLECCCRSTSKTSTEDEELPKPPPHGYQLFPPPPPQEILANRSIYAEELRFRKYWPPENTPDTPLFCLYRLYEFIVIDDVTGYRNTIEYFCRKRTWAVRDIPDPKDGDPTRYAFLACLPALLKSAFNERIKLGIVRDIPAIMSADQAEAYRTAPESSKTYEEEPQWTEGVEPLKETLFVSSHDGVIMEGFDDPRASRYFKPKNILIWGPHIHFT
ncbi:MAG: hypothetical protein Q9208_004169 [Pyrenodesmia sp. 3 TL-2023]